MLYCDPPRVAAAANYDFYVGSDYNATVMNNYADYAMWITSDTGVEIESNEGAFCSAYEGQARVS